MGKVLTGVLAGVLVFIGLVQSAGAADVRVTNHNVEPPNGANDGFLGIQIHVQDYNPASLTTQEHCAGFGLSAWLENRNAYWQHQTYQVDATDYQCTYQPGNDTKFNIAYGLGLSPLGSTMQFATQSSNDTGHGAYTGRACVRVSAWGVLWWTCSAHLTTDDTKNYAQLTQMEQNLEPLVSPVLVGADANREPGNVGVMSAWNEADDPWDKPTHGTNKIDYIWGSPSETALTGQAASVHYAADSDHKVMTGRFDWL